jgi:hypothetical protein
MAEALYKVPPAEPFDRSLRSPFVTAWRSNPTHPLGLSRRTLRSTLATAIRETPLDVGRVRPRVVEKRRECFGQRAASLVEDQSFHRWPLATSMRAPAPVVVAVPRVVDTSGRSPMAAAP